VCSSDLLDATNTILLNLGPDAVNAANQVTSFMNELRSQIDARERELLATIEKQREEQEKKLSLEKERLEYLLESMRHCLDYSNNLLDYGNPVEIASTSQPVLSRLSFLLSSSIPPSQQPKEPFLQFKETEKEIQTILSSAGQIISLGSSQQQQQKQKEKVAFLLILSDHLQFLNHPFFFFSSGSSSWFFLFFLFFLEPGLSWCWQRRSPNRVQRKGRSAIYLPWWNDH